MSEDSRRRVERNPLRLLDSKDPADAPFVASAPTFESYLCDACREHFDAVKAYLDLAKIPFVVNPRIVRGLDYYGRTVFEITSSVLGAQSSVCGGGRYDGLVRSLGGPDVPAVGFALGMERFLMMLDAVAAAGRAAAPRHPGDRAGRAGSNRRRADRRRAAPALDAPVFADYKTASCSPT